MKHLFLLLIFTTSICFAKGIRKQISQNYADMTSGEATVYSVGTGKDLEVRSILFSAKNNSGAVATFQLKDSGSVIHTFFLPEIESGGHVKTLTQNITFDDFFIFEDNIKLNLSAGDSASVSASITVLGFER